MDARRCPGELPATSISSNLSCFDQMTVSSVAYTDWTDDASANPRQ